MKKTKGPSIKVKRDNVTKEFSIAKHTAQMAATAIFTPETRNVKYNTKTDTMPKVAEKNLIATYGTFAVYSVPMFP